MKNLVIAGAGGFASEAFAWIKQAHKREYQVIGFYDGTSDNRKSIFGLPVLNSFQAFNGAEFLPAVGDPLLKGKMMAEAVNAGMKICEPIIHSTAIFGDNVRIGNGSIICPNVVVTSNATIGHGVILNLHVTVGHDSYIHDLTTVSPGANISGNVVVNRSCYIGTNSCIREKLEIGSGSIVGMGAVVTRNVPPQTTVVGNPAREKIKLLKGEENEKNIIYLRPDGPHTIQP